MSDVIIATYRVGEPRPDRGAGRKTALMTGRSDFLRRPDRSLARRCAFPSTAAYAGLAGDTLASALLANGVHLVGRSFKYHRPRGIVSAGAEEPNALVGDRRRRTARRAEPARHRRSSSTTGWSRESQNRWPSLALRFRRGQRLVAPLFPAGFYYKTFMWPRGVLEAAL